MTGEGFRRQPERISDPLLTMLTIMLAVLLFVVQPLHFAGAVTGHYVGFDFVAVLIIAAFMAATTATLLPDIPPRAWRRCSGARLRVDSYNH
jgi:hypothetical protein